MCFSDSPNGRRRAPSLRASVSYSRRRRRRRRRRLRANNPRKVAHVTAAAKKGSSRARLFSLSLYATLVIVRSEWSVKNKASLAHKYIIYIYSSWKSNRRYRRVLHTFTYHAVWCIYNVFVCVCVCVCVYVIRPRGMKSNRSRPDVYILYNCDGTLLY